MSVCRVLVVLSRIVAGGERESKGVSGQQNMSMAMSMSSPKSRSGKEVCLRLDVSCWIPSAPSRPPPPSARRRCRARQAEAESRRIRPGDLPILPGINT